MNTDILHLMDRTYPEIAGDVLTTLVGGIANEPIFFDVKTDIYPLAEPAGEIRSITGTREGERHSFVQGVDYEFSLSDNSVIWTSIAASPDDETTFFVDYTRKSARVPITDINVGSVARTMVEAISRELTTLSRQIKLAYESGFIDTATGRSLDLVVSILGIVRKTANLATGRVRFFRDPAVGGAISIPQGTVVSAKEGGARFETGDLRTLQPGQSMFDVPIEAAEGFEGEAGRVAAGEITEIARPIAGIQRVANFEATELLAGEDESDEGLRARAKRALRALGTGTIHALQRVIAEAGVTLSEISDPNTQGTGERAAGLVKLVLEGKPSRVRGAVQAIHETRAAGVFAEIVTRYLFLKPRILAFTRTEVTGAGKEKLKTQIIAAVQELVDNLEKGRILEGSRLIEAVTVPSEVSAAQIVDFLIWRSDKTATQQDLKIEALLDIFDEFATGAGATSGAAEREAELRNKLRKALDSEQNPPGGDASPEQGLVRLPSEEGEPAQEADFDDQEVREGGFEISPVVEDDEPWWFALQMNEADIVLMPEGS